MAGRIGGGFKGIDGAITCGDVMRHSVRKPTFNEELAAAPGDLLAFVDETGHETFAGNQGFYGLGGCIVTRLAYDHLKARWREVRKIINGDPDAPLHASTLKRTPENFAALSAFFLDRSFFRIAVTTTKAIGLPEEMHPCVAVVGQLNAEIAAAAAFPSCERIWIIIESSERADPMVKRCFGQLAPLNVTQPLAVEHCLMPKNANEPGLEVADFIISAASSQTQRRLRGQGGQAPDFFDVFCRLPAAGCRYREVTEVVVHAHDIVSATGVHLIDAPCLQLSIRSSPISYARISV